MASARVISRQISSCKFSPHVDGIVSCSTSASEQPFGPGNVDIFRLNENSCNLELVNSLAWSNAILETCWAASDPDVLIGGCADNSIQLWKCWNDEGKPSTSLLGHTAPVTSVEWRDGGQLLSSSLDGHFNVWDPEQKTPIVRRNLGGLILQATLCPSSRHIVASVLNQKQLRVIDYRCPTDVVRRVSSKDQILCCDWSPHHANNLLISMSQGSVGNFDLRMSKFENSSGLQCHRGPVRRARWLSAYNGLAVSVGFDGTTVISDIYNGSVLERIRHHSHVVYDVDCSPFHPGLLVDCSWDSLLHIFEPRSLSSKPLFTPFQNKL